jgi:hypothetical protein
LLGRRGRRIADGILGMRRMAQDPEPGQNSSETEN